MTHDILKLTKEFLQRKSENTYCVTNMLYIYISSGGVLGYTRDMKLLFHHHESL